jgi:glycosyltransferase involved in cell wall biosynthesis
MAPAPGPIHVLAIPIADRETASSRVRLYDLVAKLPDRFAVSVVRAGDDADLHRYDPARFDLVYVQKDARPAVVGFCRRAAAAGVPIVYDIDDDFGTWPGMAEETMCRLARTVTVDSRGRADALAAHARTKPVVLPCMIDLADDPARAGLRLPRQDIAAVASFGNLVSLRNTLSYLAAVPPAVAIYVIGPADAGSELPGVRLVPFGLGSFVAELLAADVFILAHGEREVPLKDNNRLIIAMSLGVPSLVSPTPAYLEVLDDLGLPWLACRPGQVGDRLARLADPDVRSEIGRIGFEYAWANYEPERCAALLAGILDAARIRA